MKMTTENFVDLTLLSVQNLDPKCLIMDDLFLQPVNNFSVMFKKYLLETISDCQMVWIFLQPVNNFSVMFKKYLLETISDCQMVWIHLIFPKYPMKMK